MSQPTTPMSAGDQSPGSTGDSAQEKATHVASTAKESGAQTAQTAAGEAQHVAAETKEQARDLAQEAMSQLREQAGAQQEKVVSGLRELVEELRAMADGGGKNGLATEAAHQGADRAKQAADWLEHHEPGDLLDEVRRFGRRRPGAFLAGAALAGVLAGRLTRGMTADQHAGSHRSAGSDGSAGSAGRPLPPGPAASPPAHEELPPGPAQAADGTGEYLPAQGGQPASGGGAYPLPGTPENPVTGPS